MGNYAIYLGHAAAKNLDTAIERGMWGWTDTVLDSPGQNYGGTTGRERVQMLKPGDTVTIATGEPGKSLRRDFDPNREIVLRRIVTGTVRQSMYVDTSPVWEPHPDRYVNRVDLEFTNEQMNLSNDDVDDVLLRALTKSLNRGATPFFVGAAAPASNPPWDEYEQLAALGLYLERGMLSKTHVEVVALSDELRQRQLSIGNQIRESYRNPAGIALKLANFAHLDPVYPGRGMSQVSEGDRNAWAKYSGDSDSLFARLAALARSEGLSSEVETVATQPDDRHPLTLHPVELAESDSFEVTIDYATRIGRRREAGLVQAFRRFLEAEGHEVGSHHYDVDDSTLRSDLVDMTDETVWEAKAEVGRNAVRLAIGQLLDYRRFEPSDWSIGVLLPRRPSDDLLDLCESTGAAVAWLESHDPLRFSRHTSAATERSLTRQTASGAGQQPALRLAV